MAGKHGDYGRAKCGQGALVPSLFSVTENYGYVAQLIMTVKVHVQTTTLGGQILGSVTRPYQTPDSGNRHGRVPLLM